VSKSDALRQSGKNGSSWSRDNMVVSLGVWSRHNAVWSTTGQRGRATRVGMGRMVQSLRLMIVIFLTTRRMSNFGNVPFFLCVTRTKSKFKLLAINWVSNPASKQDLAARTWGAFQY